MKTLAALALCALASCYAPQQFIDVRTSEPTAKIYHFERVVGEGAARVQVSGNRYQTFRAVAVDGRTVSETLTPEWDWRIWVPFAAKPVYRLPRTEVYLDLPPAPSANP